MYTLVAVALVISLMITAAPPAAVAATGGTVKAEWERVDTPITKDWVLAPESMIVDFATAEPGHVAYSIVYTEYARHVPPDDPEDWAPWYLVKSTDHAATWKDITEAVDDEVRKITKTDDLAPSPDYELVQVACGPDDTHFVAVALNIVHADYGGLYVFISIDGGTNFKSTGVVDTSLNAGNIYDFAVSPEVDDVRDIAIAGAPGIWRSQARGSLATAWDDAHAYDGWDDEDQAPNNLDPFEAVVAVHFPPSWAADNTILVVTVNDGSGYLQSGVWDAEGDGSWNVEANFKPAVKLEDTLRFAVPAAVPWWTMHGATATITTPSDYSGRNTGGRYAWVHLNYVNADDEPQGKIFRIRDGTASAVTEQIYGSPWLTNVHYVGTITSGKAIAGLLGTGQANSAWEPIPTEPCQVVQVYRYDDVKAMDICCPEWVEACKPPTGSLGMAAFYVKEDKAYAVALGGTSDYDEGAWSWSFDDGDTWNQLSLVNTHIDFLSDVAVSPDCNKTMLVSVNFNGCDSVWYHAKDLSHYGFTEYNGKWMRTWSGQLGPEQYGMLRLAPDEDDGKNVYLVDRGTDKVYYNKQQTLACWEPGRAKVSQIVDLAVKTKTTIYALGHDGKVTMSDDYGVYASFTTPVETKLDNGWTLALWGDEILVGSQDGHVAHSPHGTGNFTKLTKETKARLPTEGLVTIAFDSYYGDNDTIYAAVDAFPQGGIYRWVAGESTQWFDMKAYPSMRQLTGDYLAPKSPSYSVAYTGLVLDNYDGNPKTSPATGGVLYASYVYNAGTSTDPFWHTGVARMLTPALDYCCDETEWDYLVQTEDNRALNQEMFAAMPHALKICGCLDKDSYTRLFSIDLWGWYDMQKREDGNVWMFEDCYSKSGPSLRNPDDGALMHSDPCDGCRNTPFTIAWDRMCDSCNYEIEFALDKDFYHIFPVPGWERPDPFSCIARPGHEVRPVPAVNPAMYIPSWFTPGQTYYWRVRSVMAENGQVIRSWWSDERSFTINLRATDGVYLVSPEPGTTNVARTGIGFTWDANIAVTSYRFELSQNADLSIPVEPPATGLTRTSYKYTGTALAYDTTYFWRVTAYRDGAEVSKAIGQFRTVAETPVDPEPEPVTTPNWVWVLIAIGAVLVIVVIVLIFRTRRV